jgi:2-polyprenyl-3-methyl-5-hydroxy-6-metoxy-1,4-benzoquinol methylase
MSETFDDVAARDAWDAGADAWLHFVQSGADYYRTYVHGPALLDACTVQRGEDVLDLGCGEGFFTRALAQRGGRVVGLELSSKMLANAHVEEARQPLGIRYQNGSATELEAQFAPGTFDLVASCMAIQDMSDPAACIAGCAHVLRPDGRLVFSVPHPCTDTPFREWERDAARRKIALKVDRYFETGPTECPWNMPRLTYHWTTPCWRRTLEEWAAMIVTAGFLIEGILEPRPSAEQVAMRPELEDCARLPYFLVFRGIRR